MMRFKSLSFTGLLLSACLRTYGQDSTMFIALETGVDFIGCESVEKEYIRAENPDPNQIFNPRIKSELYKSFVGLKIEKKTSNDRFGFSSGLRFTQLRSSVTKSGLPEYFYFRVQQTGTTTEYLRVKGLAETSNYVGIPVEVRMFSRRKPTFRFFVAAGAEWSYQLTTKTDVKFHELAMESYHSAVEDIIGEAKTWYMTFYTRVGFILGSEKPRLSIALTAPIGITDRVSSLNLPITGAGFQIQYQVPFKSKRV